MNWYHAFEIGLQYLEVLIWPVLVGLVFWFFRDEIKYILRERDWEGQGPFGTQVTVSSQPGPDREDVEEASQIAEEEETRPEPGEIDEAIRRSQEEQIHQLQLWLYFERAAQWMFGSQLSLLFEITAHGDREVGPAPIAKYYAQYRNSVGPEAAMSQKQWLTYLTEWNLIELKYGATDTGFLAGLMEEETDVNKVILGATLTDVGRSFVQYCQARAYTPEKFPN